MAEIPDTQLCANPETVCSEGSAANSARLYHRAPYLLGATIVVGKLPAENARDSVSELIFGGKRHGLIGHAGLTSLRSPTPIARVRWVHNDPVARI
jgi:hypothetical protein